MSNIMVEKNDGSFEPLQIKKATDSLVWATGDLKGVSASDIEMQSKLHFYDGIKTSYILDVFIKVTYDMSSLRNINYDAVCKNLKIQKLYKHLYKGIKPCSLKEFIKGKEDIYNKNIYSYSKEELDVLEKEIDHSRDFNFTASGLDAVIDSYGLKDSSGEPSESPQFIFMLIAMDAFRHENLDMVLALYEALSNFKVTLPTPEMKAFRTHSSDYASCCTIRMGDSIDSWNEASNAIVSHTVASAGVGISIVDIASIGDKVKKGLIKHSGKIPVVRDIDTSIAKASQNGRRGSGTVFFNFFDPEFESIMALKSPRTALDKRVNDLSYGICMHKLVYRRAKEGKDITLFSTRQAPQLVHGITNKEPDEFIKMYEKAEKQFPNNPKISAQDLFDIVANERFENSSYYIVNIDDANTNTPYLEPIVQSNICVEFLTPTKPLSRLLPDDPAIGICVLGNINQSAVPVEDLPHYTALLVKLQSSAALRQDHPTSQANAFVNGYRDIGIGFSNHAHWVAKNGWRYGNQEALNAHNHWMEHFSYGLIKASMELAKEKGPAPLFDKTNWNTTFPQDRANKNAKALISSNHNYKSPDWDKLRKDVNEFGMFNCGLSMVPPAESSSIPSNQNSSQEPIKEGLTIKDKQGFNHKQYAPDAIKYAAQYDYAYDRKNMTRDFFKHCAVTQMWIDKASSVNAFYNPELYPEEKVDIVDIVSDIFFAKKLGIKTIYYQNTKIKDPNGNIVQQETGCGPNGGCSV